MEDYDTILSSQSPQSSSIESQNEDELFEMLMTDNAKFYCCLQPDCGKTFKFKSEMKRHIVIHLKQRPYVCKFSHCGKSFKRSDALNNHLKAHTNKIQFKCKVEGCHAQLSTKSALSYHTLKHDGKKMFKCTYPDCFREFLTSAQLKQHENASTYHQRIQSSTETDHSSPKQGSLQGSDTDISFGPEYILDYNHDKYNNHHDNLACIGSYRYQESTFDSQFHNHSLNRLSKYLDTFEGDSEHIEFIDSQKGFYDDTVKSKFMTLMNEVFYDDQDLKEKLNSCIAQMQSRTKEQSYFQSEIDVNSFFKSSHDQLELNDERGESKL